MRAIHRYAPPHMGSPRIAGLAPDADGARPQRERLAALRLGVVAALLASCGAPGAAPPSRSPEAAAPLQKQGAAVEFGGWIFAPEDDAALPEVRPSADGRRAFMLRGTRWLLHPDGSIERARQVFREEEVRAAELPARLGGGYIFYATSGGATSLWRARSWTGELTPLARVEPPVTELTSGFDRIYVTGSSSSLPRALDPSDGTVRDLGPLPAAAAYGPMIFADAWRAVVLGGVRGPLATFDAGESWQPVRAPAAVTELGLTAEGAIELGTDVGRIELSATGQLLETSARGSDALFAGADTFTRYPRQAFAAAASPEAPRSALGRPPLRAALLHGWPDTAESAVVVEGSVLARVRLRDGKLLDAQPYRGRAPCRGVALGDGFGFVCGDAHGPTEVYAYREGRLELEFSLAGPRLVRSSGNGALVVAAPCSALRLARDADSGNEEEEQDGGAGRYCVRHASGGHFELRVRGDVGAERITALRDGRVVVLTPPRSSAPGRLSIVSSSGSTSVPLSLTPSDGPAARLVRAGSWLDEVRELSPGVLGAWVVGARAFVGVKVSVEGEVKIARPQDGVEETAFHGPFALQIAASASVRETTDQGFDWRTSELPPGLTTPTGAARRRRPVRGCSVLGCVYDDWLRVGYAKERAALEVPRPDAPPRASFPSPGYAFWTLECAPEAAESVRAPVVARRRPAGAAARVRRGELRETSAWIGFQGVPPPDLSSTDVGYDFGEVGEHGGYRAYAWGPPVGEWSRRGAWQLRVGDRFSLAAPWSTSVSVGAWTDAAAAAQAFGLDPNVGVDWWLRLEASGEQGILQVRVRSETSLHLIDRGRPIVTLEPTSSVDLGSVGAALAVADRWYLASSRGEQLQLYRVNRRRPELVATYPLYARVPTQLVRSVHGDELALLQKVSGGGWYIYPIHPESFEPQAPLRVSSADLGRVPPPCEPGRPGWSIVSGVPLTDSGASESNTHLDFAGGARGLRTKRLTARLVAYDGGVCVDALAALTDGGPPRNTESAGAVSRRSSLPLVVTDAAEERRWSFRCAPP